MRSIAIMTAQRLAIGLLTLWLVSLVIFLSITLLPGDFATEILGQSALPETVEAFRRTLGLDQPLHVRYFSWLAGIVRGEFGWSFSGGEIAAMLWPRLANTLILALSAAAVSVPLALTLGILTALYRNTLFDRAVNLITLSWISFPEFFVAYILILLLSVKAGLLPSLANINPSQSFWETMRVIALPTVTLSLAVIAHMMRMTRAAIIDVLTSPFIEMAILKGAGRRRIIFHHALPNALAPIINVVVINLAFLVVGVVVVEVVFVFPGLGQWMVDSVQTRDILVVQACSMIFAMTYIVLNLAADVLATVTNPRLMHPR